MSKTQYKINGTSVLSVTVAMTFDEIIESFSKAEYAHQGKSALIGKIQQIVAAQLADKFILQHAQEVLAQIDPKQVANLVTLNALDRLGGTSGGR